MGARRRWAGFDVLRLVAACAVVLSHVVLLSGGDEPVPLAWTGVRWPLGTSAVAVFFVVSGFLVARSWRLDPRPAAYALRRAARIWPALLAVVLVTALVVGPLVTTLGAREYLSSSKTWEYVAGNAVLSTVYTLPGVFTANPLDTVNGSLWSLPLEVACYLLLAGLGMLGLLRRTSVLPALTAGALLLAWVCDVSGLLDGAGTLVSDGPALLALFLLGSLAERVGVPRSPWLVVAAVVALVATHDLPLSGIGYVCVAFLVVRAGTAGWSGGRRLQRLGDPSYGTFLWGWPVTQLLVLAGVTAVVPLAATALPVSLTLGYLSWWALERRVLDRARLRLRESPVAVDARPRVPGG